MDAANVDLEGFTERFYAKRCAGSLEPVLDTLKYLVHETNVWTEITTLLIPGENDFDEELDALTQWVARELKTDVPLHFTAFHPDYRMLETAPTPPATLQKARAIAIRNGLSHVYVGNVHDPARQATLCPTCGARAIGRDGYTITAYALDASGACISCGTRMAGVFAAKPGAWGARRCGRHRALRGVRGGGLFNKFSPARKTFVAGDDASPDIHLVNSLEFLTPSTTICPNRRNLYCHIREGSGRRRGRQTCEVRCRLQRPTSSCGGIRRRGSRVKTPNSCGLRKC